MKYDIGDKVMIRPDLTDNMPIRHGTNAIMARRAGQIVTITYIDVEEEYYRIAEDSESWNWTDEMLTDVRPKISLLDLIEKARCTK